MLLELGADVLQRPRSDRRAGAGEQHGIGNFARERLLLLPDQLDRFRRPLASSWLPGSE